MKCKCTRAGSTGKCDQCNHARPHFAVNLKRLSHGSSCQEIGLCPWSDEVVRCRELKVVRKLKRIITTKI